MESMLCPSTTQVLSVAGVVRRTHMVEEGKATVRSKAAVCSEETPGQAFKKASNLKLSAV